MEVLWKYPRGVDDDECVDEESDPGSCGMCDVSASVSGYLLCDHATGMMCDGLSFL